MTILAIAQACAKRLQITSPSTFIGSTDNNLILLLAMINRAIDELGNEYEWPELIREHAFLLIEGVEAYPLREDYDRKVDETLWNQTQSLPLMGPTLPAIWQQYKSGFITTLPSQRFRIKGFALNQFYIDPKPDSDINGQICVYEYISKFKRRPVTWAANTAYTTVNYVYSDGIILKCSSNGTSNTTTGRLPQLGKDYTVQWDSVPAYVASSNYYDGQYVQGNSKVYQCTTAGLSSASTPSVTSGTETLGTCVFTYVATPSAWVGGTAYAVGDCVKNTLGTPDYYICTVAGTSGKYEPVFRTVLAATGFGQYPTQTSQTITDGTAVWTVQTTGYETFIADTDEVIINNQAVTDRAVWMFLQDRGFEYEAIRDQAERQLDIIKTKLDGAETLSVRGNRYPLGIGTWSYPEGDF